MNKLSIIIPAYNCEKTILNSIDSLLKQTIDIDIIVVDDGSKDNTGKIIKKINDNRIHYYYKDNGGVASARNLGVSKVETEFFGFLDSDDIMVNNACESMLREIEEKKADICFSNFYWKYENGKQKEQIDQIYDDKKMIINNMFTVLWNKIYRTEWFRSLNINFPNGLVYEDVSVLYRLIPNVRRFSYVNIPSVYYFQKEGSISRSYDVRINDMISVFEGIKNYYLENGFYDEYKDNVEYIFTRFFLGNSYLRTVRMKNSKLRNETLEKAWQFLNSNYPNYKKNTYLNEGIKNKYYKFENKFIYKAMVYPFKLMYTLGILN